MISELDTVVLTHDIPKYGLEKGDMGAVVHRYKKDSVFEVEFVTVDGCTLALVTLNDDDIRPISGKEVLHVRELAQMAV